MKYEKLEQIIIEEANSLKECAAYSGSHTDGGSTGLLARFNKFKQNLVVKYDLRPSEFKQLNTIEVGEPAEFLSIINNFKIKLAKEIEL